MTQGLNRHAGEFGEFLDFIERAQTVTSGIMLSFDLRLGSSPILLRSESYGRDSSSRCLATLTALLGARSRQRSGIAPVNFEKVELEEANVSCNRTGLMGLNHATINRAVGANVNVGSCITSERAQ